ncbi:early nodulin-like protein 7 [Lotus japonicus]|uniref:early nodulin-like protein 7 n=1 Tax=Lotus japonicus TaxID=34305 RepID=UPI00258DB677|nr:early nodulin-like protein 7 [Lotus japonicus]
MEVSQQDYVHCNINSAKASYHSGSDSITLTKPGNFYFICSKNGHCLAGQKFHIAVHHPDQHPSSLLDTTPPSNGSVCDEGSVLLLVSNIVTAPVGSNPRSNDGDILSASCLTHTIALVMVLCTCFLV